MPLDMSFEWDAELGIPIDWHQSFGSIAEFDVAPYSQNLERVFFGADYSSGSFVDDPLFMTFVVDNSVGLTTSVPINLTPKTIPEPTLLGIVGISGMLLLSQRRRKQG